MFLSSLIKASSNFGRHRRSPPLFTQKMDPPSTKPRTAESKEQETWLKRKRGLEKKAHELSSFTRTEVHLVMFRAGRYHTYSSAERDDWPPSNSDIVSARASPLPAWLMVQENNSPPTKRKRPSDFKSIPFPNRRKRIILSRSEKPSEVESHPPEWNETRGAHNTPDMTLASPAKQARTRPVAGDRHEAESQPGPCDSRKARKVGRGRALETRKIVTSKQDEKTIDDESRRLQGATRPKRQPKRRYFSIPKLPVLPQFFEAWT